MTKELSALLDDELDIHEESGLWATLKGRPELRDTWGQYKLIGDAMRREGALARDITAEVMRGLADEPVVLAPRQPASSGRRLSSAMMALAASIAGVAVVSWLALVPGAADDTAQLARVTPSATVSKPVVVAATPGRTGMQEYILAHQLNAPGLSLQGGAQHIRTVSAASSAK